MFNKLDQLNGKFILSKDMIEDKSWNVIPISNGMFLYYHNVNIVQNRNADITLIGDAWQVLPDHLDPQEYVKTRDYLDIDALLNEEYNWAGRYILIAGGKIFLDYGGQMGLYYCGEACSNSLYLLRKYLRIPFIDPNLNYNVSPNFVLGANTQYPTIKRLLPSQSLELDTMFPQVRSIFNHFDYAQLTDAEKIDKFIELFVNSLRNMARSHTDTQIWLALSGGYDSRTAFALLCDSGIAFNAFTLEYNDISKGDASLPRKLCDRMKVNYAFIRREKQYLDRQTRNEYLTLTDYMVADRDIDFVAYNQYQSVSPSNKILVLRNGLWATIRECYFPKGITANRDIFRRIFPGLVLNQWKLNSFEDYMDMVDSDDINRDVKLQDRVYLDIRVGCWRADIEGSFDAIPNVESVDPANSRVLLDLLRHLPYSRKEGKKHEIEITRRACPAISDIPYEKDMKESENKWNKITKKIRNKLDVTRQYGIHNTIAIAKFSRS